MKTFFFLTALVLGLVTLVHATELAGGWSGSSETVSKVSYTQSAVQTSVSAWSSSDDSDKSSSEWSSSSTKVSITNACESQVYYRIAGPGYEDDYAPITMGSSVSAPIASGISVKLSFNGDNADDASISQLEYTYNSKLSHLSYDLSNINSDSSAPFVVGGVTLAVSSPETSQYPTCISILCAAGDDSCRGVYVAPDDPDTLVCPLATSLSLTLCKG